MLAWLAWPVYGFYAHRDAVPLGPFAWSEMPGDTPVTRILHDGDYGDSAIQAVDRNAVIHVTSILRN